jgi:hypothetical protein
MNAECQVGNHKLIEIYRRPYSSVQQSTVVRWCEQCGVVTVDIDYDGRTNPGAVMRMIGPKDSGYKGVDNANSISRTTSKEL